MNCLCQEIEKNLVQPEEIARLLRSIGASGRLVGFKYVVFIVFMNMQKPDERYWITKCAPGRGKGISCPAFFCRTRNPYPDCLLLGS